MKTADTTETIERERGGVSRAADTASLVSRREYKFLIDAKTAAGIRRAIAPFCRLDPFAAASPTRSYTIESLYFDTDDLALFWANDHEVNDRIKMRVRRYPDAPASFVFLEVKRRVNDVILKTRGRVARDAWIHLLEDPGASIPDGVERKDRAGIERFLAIAGTLHVRPVTLVQYRREPYVSTIDDYARVTFDTQVRAQAANALSFDHASRGWRAIDDAIAARMLDALVVLELKFTSHVPLWLVHIAQGFGLERGAFSKYGNSIRAFHTPVDPRVPRFAGGAR
jgi:hypothetical protein